MLALAAAAVVGVVAGVAALAVFRDSRRIGSWFPQRAGDWAGEARLAARSMVRWPVLWRTVLLGIAFPDDRCRCDVAGRVTGVDGVAPEVRFVEIAALVDNGVSAAV